MEISEITQFYDQIDQCLRCGKTIEAKNILDRLSFIPSVTDLPAELIKFFYRFNFEVKGRLDDGTFIDDGLKSLEYIDNDDEKALTYYQCACYLLQKGKIAEAEKYSLLCDKLANSDEMKMDAKKMLGRTESYKKNYDEALKNFNEAAYYAEESHNERSLCLIILEIADIFEKKGFPEIAISEISRAETHAKASTILDLYLRCAVKKAKLLYELGRNDDAQKVIMSIPEQND